MAFIFLRLCSSACSWRKCCVCQCSVSIQCCCEPKLPRLRVIPATGDPRLSRGQLEPSPPPSYLDIYPDTQTSDLLTPVSLSLVEQHDTNLLNPNTLPVLAADIRYDPNQSPVLSSSLRSLTPPPTSRQVSLPGGREEGEEVPGLDQGPHLADTAEFDWGSVASFPSPEQEVRVDRDTLSSAVTDGVEAGDIFTVYTRQRGVITTVRPTTC